MPTSKHVFHVLIVGLCMFGFIFSACAENVPYAGTWAGSIGAQQVRVCFAGPEDSQYYYLKQVRGIRLLAEGVAGSEDATSAWKELDASLGEKVTGIWEVVMNSADGSMAGTWHEPQSDKKLQVKLDKIGELENQICGPEFYQPIKASTSERTKSWPVFFLPNSYKGADRINALVRSWLEESALEDYKCQLRYGNNKEQELNIEVLTERILVIRKTVFDVYCGGAHNDGGTFYEFFDPRNGKEIDPWKWIRGGRKATEADSRLRAMIEKLNPATTEGNSDCANGFEVLPPIPTQHGFEFPTRYIWALRTCDSSVAIPYGALRAYLTVRGRAVAASMHRH